MNIQSESIKSGVTEYFNQYGIGEFEMENGALTTDGAIALQEFTRRYMDAENIDMDENDVFAIVSEAFRNYLATEA